MSGSHLRRLCVLQCAWIEDGMANDLGKGHVGNGLFASVASDDRGGLKGCSVDLNWVLENPCPQS